MQDKSVYKKYAVLSLLYLLVFWFTASKAGHAFDVRCFTDWGRHIFEHGMGTVYDSGSDYLPLFHHMMKLFVSLQRSVDHVNAHIHYLKVFSIISLLVTGFYMMRIFEEAGISRDNLIYNVFFLLFNMAILYNTLIWNQVDIILSAFVFISTYYAIKQKTLLSLFFLLLGLNFKMHAVVFIPVIGLLVLPDVVRSFRSGRILVYLAVLAVVQTLIMLPFIMAGTAHEALRVAFASFDKYPFVSISAYNVWPLLTQTTDLTGINDTILFWGLTYKFWGLLMFFISSGIALLPLLKQCYYKIFTRKTYEVPLQTNLLIFTLVSFLFFFFNTQMHERYSHVALAYLVAYGVLKKRPVLVFLGSFAYILSLEKVVKFLELPNYGTLIFDPYFISMLYFATIVWLYIDLFRKPAAAPVVN